MYTLQVDELDDGAIALKTAIHLRNATLTTILIDISGSIAGPNIYNTILNTLYCIAYVLEISTDPDSLVTLIQFDDNIRNAVTIPRSKLTANFLKKYAINARGGSALLSTAECVNSKKEAVCYQFGQPPSLFNFQRRIGVFEKTPVMLISDGYISDINYLMDSNFLDTVFGTENTFFMKYGYLT